MEPFRWSRASVGTAAGALGAWIQVWGFDQPGWIWVFVPMSTVSCGWPVHEDRSAAAMVREAAEIDLALLAHWTPRKKGPDCVFLCVI
jgi:hypothetical protein